MPFASRSHRFPARGLFSVLLFAVLASSPVESELFVANQGSPPSILVYADDATGEATPLREIVGDNTELVLPGGLALDLVHRELFVADQSGKVLVFALDADGDSTPLRVIDGVPADLVMPTGIAVDLVHDELVVVDTTTKTVKAFARDADIGASPLRTISATFVYPGPVVVDIAADEIYVSDPSAFKVFVFARTDEGSVSPLRSYSALAPGGIFVDRGRSELTYALPISNKVDTVPLATGSSRSLVGESTGISTPLGVLLTSTGKLWVNNWEASGLVQAFAALSNGDVPPLQTIFRTGVMPTTLASDRALGCTEGFVASDCLYRDGFESGDVCRWSEETPTGGC